MSQNAAEGFGGAEEGRCEPSSGSRSQSWWGLGCKALEIF